MKQVDVLCIGHACLDLTFTIETNPGPDEKIRTHQLISEGGGPAANAAYAINLLGGSSAFSGRLGKDSMAEEHLRELNDAGVDTSCILQENTRTPVSSVLINKLGQRSIVNYRDADAYGELNIENIEPACILIDGHEWEASEKALRAFPELPSILDAGSFRESTDSLANKVTYLIASSTFAKDATQYTNPDNWLNGLASRAPYVAITNGVDGIYWKNENGKQGHIRAKKVKAVNTNAAGDIFHGAFALALTRESGFEEALRWANEVAAISVTRPGGRSSYPRRNEVPPLIKE